MLKPTKALYSKPYFSRMGCARPSCTAYPNEVVSVGLLPAAPFQGAPTVSGTRSFELLSEAAEVDEHAAVVAKSAIVSRAVKPLAARSGFHGVLLAFWASW